MDLDHINLSTPCCVICRQEILVYEKAFAGITVFGRSLVYKGHSTAFEFPTYDPHMLRWTYANIVYDGKKKRCALCRSPTKCAGCARATSPYGLLVHVDCSKLLERLVPSITYKEIYRLGKFCRPFYDVSRLDRSTVELGGLDPTLVSRMLRSSGKGDDLKSLAMRISKLPQKLALEIFEYSRMSLLWRFASVLSWNIELLKEVQNLVLKTINPKDISSWTRNLTGGKQTLQIESEDTFEDIQYFRMGIDELGIRFIKYYPHRPTSEDTDLPPCPWYMVDDISYFEPQNFYSNGYFLLVGKKPLNPDSKTAVEHWNTRYKDPAPHWDTPTPPDLSVCRIFNSMTLSGTPSRLRCIDLDSQLTGLSVFGTGFTVYGIFGHHKSPSDAASASEAYTNICLRRSEKIQWLYFPLGETEKIDAIWAQWKKSASTYCDPDDTDWFEGYAEPAPPSFVIRTSLGRLYSFGVHADPVKQQRDRDYMNRAPVRPPDIFEILGFGDPSFDPVGPPHVEPWSYSTRCLSSGHAKHFFYNDHRPGEPVSFFGAYSDPPRPGKPRSPSEEVPRIKNKSSPDVGMKLFYSTASLANIQRVEVFSEYHTPRIRDRDLGMHESHIGVLITHTDGSQEALGECRVGHSRSTVVEEPKMLYWKYKYDETQQYEDDDAGCFGVQLEFSTKVMSFNEAYRTAGWTSAQPLEGVVEWWFGSEVVLLGVSRVGRDGVVSKDEVVLEEWFP